MKTFTVYFEVYNKKMKVSVKALNETKAIEQVRKDVIIHKVNQVNTDDDVLDQLKNIFNFK